MKKQQALSGLTALALAHSITASAQGLEEVVVTAQKRAEDLQTTPISMTAFSAEKLSELGAQRAIDIAQYTPNVNIVTNNVSNTGIAVGIRGIQAADAAMGADSKIGIYLDGVYLARIAAASFDVVDIQQIEVLRGPQGTLWGKNTTGGAINIVTEKPRGSLGFRQSFSFGNYDYFRSHTTIDTPTWNGLSAKLSYDRSRKDGEIRNTHPGNSKRPGDMDNEAYAIALRWQPSDTFTADYTYDRHNRDGIGPGNQMVAVNPQLAALPTALLNTAGGQVQIENPFWSAARGASTSRLSAFDINAREEHNDLAGHNLTLSWQVGDAEIKSISSYRTYDGIKPGDFDGGGYATPLFEADLSESQRQISQELQITGDAFEDRLKYVAGLYYFREKTSTHNPQHFVVQTGTASSGELILAALNSPLIYTTHNESKAAYGQFSYTPPILDDKLRVTLGLRYTEDEKEADLISRNARGSDTWSSLNPAFVVDYQASEDINVYGKVTTGYNAGVFNVRAASAAIFQKPADAENLINYELGFKSEWFDQRLRFNAAAFWMDYTDLQVSQFVASPAGASTIITNAGEAEIKGFELEMIARPIPALTLSASWGYTDVDYKEFITSVNQITGQVVDSADSAKPVLAPRNTGNAAIDYEIGRWEFGKVSARADVTHSDGFDFNPFLTRYTHASGHTLYNARLTLADMPALSGNLRISLWGKNLTNEKYRVNGIDFGVDSASLGYAIAVFGPLRSYGADIAYEFQ